MRNEFTAMMETTEEGDYLAYGLEISGANGQGDIIEECKQNLAEAIPAGSAKRCTLIIQDCQK